MLTTVRYHPAAAGADHESDAEYRLYGRFEDLARRCGYVHLPKEERSRFHRACVLGNEGFTVSDLEDGYAHLMSYLENAKSQIRAERARCAYDTWKQFCDTKMGDIDWCIQNLNFWMADARQAMALAIPDHEFVDPYYIDKMREAS